MNSQTQARILLTVVLQQQHAVAHRRGSYWGLDVEPEVRFNAHALSVGLSFICPKNGSFLREGCAGGR